MEDNAVINQDEIAEQVKSHDRIVVEDSEGKEYTLRYTRKVVKEMEKKGVTAQHAAELLSAGTLTATEDFIRKFVAPALKTDQPKMTENDVVDLWAEIDGKETLIAYLVALFSQPMLSLVTNPTETRAKFRLV